MGSRVTAAILLLHAQAHVYVHQLFCSLHLQNMFSDAAEATIPFGNLIHFCPNI